MKTRKQSRIWRKGYNGTFSLKEWSRMLHLWWKKDLVHKLEFKKGKHECL